MNDMTEDEPRKEDQQPPVKQVTLLPEAPAQGRLLAIYQSPETDTLIFMNSHYCPARPTEKGDRTIIASHGGMNFTIPQTYDKELLREGGLGPGVGKLFRYCSYLLAEGNEYKGTGEVNETVVLNIDEYMNACKPKGEKGERENDTPARRAKRKYKLRRRLESLAELLFYGALEWEDEKTVNALRLFGKRTLDKGTGDIYITFDQDTAKLLRKAYIGHLSKDMFRLDERNPNLVPLYCKLALHAGLQRNQERDTADIISVKALLNSCPGTPDISQVRGGDRAFGRRIIASLERDLDALVEGDLLVTWEYCGPKKAILTEEQLNAADFKTFYSMYVTFKMKDEPERTNAQVGAAAKPKRLGKPKASKGKRRKP